MKYWKKVIVLFFLAFMAAYPIYKNFYYGRAITSYERHIAIMERRSEYFNPWQYRVLSPWLVERAIFIYDHTVDRIYPVEEKWKVKLNTTSTPTQETREFFSLMEKKGALKYTIVLAFLRWVINGILLLLAYRYFSVFTLNKYLAMALVGLVSWAMGNGVLASDLTMNTYLDNIFYLLAGLLVLKKWHPAWILPLTALAAFNRETSLLIPMIFFVSYLNWPGLRLSTFRKISFPSGAVWLYTIGAYGLFFLVFFSIRAYFGYQPPQIWKVPSGLPMIKLNLFSAVAAKNFFEVYGVVGVFPLIILLGYRYCSDLLKKWLITLVPVWFVIHFAFVVAYQSRLFLVPLIFIFIPMTIEIIEGYGDKRSGAARANPALSEKN